MRAEPLAVAVAVAVAAVVAASPWPRDSAPHSPSRLPEELEALPTGTSTPPRCRPRSLPAVRPDELEHRLRERLDALGPAPRAELLHVLMLPELDGC
jgi:hypothetical protein